MYRPLAPLNLEPARYTCYRAAGPITVDGKLDEPSWQLAPKSTPFVDIVSGEPAWFDTRVALLWDDDNLYFGFWVEETDVWGTMTKRDSKIWEENDIEVFIGGKDAYYEFEVNALNTVYEVFWIWKDILQPGSPYYGRPEFDPAKQRTMVLDGVGGHVHPRGERWGFLDWDFPGLRTAVHVDGSGQQPDQYRPRMDGGAGVPVARTGGPCGWTISAAEGWRCLAHRLFALREAGAQSRSAGPVRGLDVESPRALRFAYSGGVPLRDVLGEDGGVGD